MKKEQLQHDGKFFENNTNAQEDAHDHCYQGKPLEEVVELVYLGR
jgi:hypothetical protein